LLAGEEMDGKYLEDGQLDRSDKDKGKEINLKALYSTLRRRLWMIALITIGITVAAGLYNARPEAPVYASSSRIIVAASAEMMSTLKVMVREPIVLTKVIDELNLPQSVGELRGQLRADSVEGSLVTVITAVDSDADRAAAIANKTVEVYRQVANDTLGVSSIRILTDAQPNPFSINQKSNTSVFIAFVASLVLSVALVFLLDSLDDSIKTEREIEELLGLTMLGQVSSMKRRDYKRASQKQKTIVTRGETIGS
jgi:capsular polysaccharide biosynthesis protein